MQGYGISLILAVFLCGVTHAAPAPLSRLESGNPGCWNLIHSGAMSDAEIKALPLDCTQFREDYFASIEASKKSPVQYEKKIVQVLKHATKPKAPYEAIFFATLIHSPKMVDALKVRAATEKKLKVPFAYATVALYRLGGKDCVTEPHYTNEFYREVCNGEDSILPTFFNLSGGKK